MEPVSDSLLYLVIIWLGVYVAVICARKTRLTPVLYFLAVGAVLVNLGILPTDTGPFIGGLADIGIVLIMFALGFEENTANFLKSVKRSWGIALFGAVAPFFTAWYLSLLFWDDRNIALMCGLAMTATAVSLTMVSLKNEGLERSVAATGIMTSAVLDDIAALALVAVLVPMATGDIGPGPGAILWVIGKALLFFLLVSVIGTWIFPPLEASFLSRLPLIGRLRLGRFGIRNLLLFSNGDYAVLTVLTLALGIGLIAQGFGFHPAVGAYMAGLVLREEYFGASTGNTDSTGDAGNGLYQDTRRIVESAAFAWIGPVFFVHLGTRIVFDWDIFVAVIPETVALTAALMAAQISSAALAARYTGHFTGAQSMMIGFGMLGRAELAFVIMDIAYVQHPILNPESFYTLMFTAFWLNVSVPITIAWWKPRYAGIKR